LFVPRRADGGRAGEMATIERSNPAAAATSRVSSSTVTMVRLDEAVREPVGFIKVDVEGHEFAVLRGAERILREDRPVLLVESAGLHNPASPGDVLALAAEHGYDGVFLRNGRLAPLSSFRADIHQQVGPDGRPAKGYVFNLVFLPRDRPGPGMG
jgi:hypothetical protein